MGAAFLIAACSEQSPPLPPLLQDATTTGGITDLCEDNDAGPVEPVTNATTVSHSPEVVERLERDFPRGSKSEDLKAALLQMGFEMQPCSGAFAARFDQAGGDETSSTQVTSTIVWKANPDGRIVWTTGDIAYTGR